MILFSTILFANPENDKSDEIIKRLGYTPQKNTPTEDK